MQSGCNAKLLSCGSVVGMIHCVCNVLWQCCDYGMCLQRQRRKRQRRVRNGNIVFFIWHTGAAIYFDNDNTKRQRQPGIWIWNTHTHTRATCCRKHPLHFLPLTVLTWLNHTGFCVWLSILFFACPNGKKYFQWCCWRHRRLSVVFDAGALQCVVRAFLGACLMVTEKSSGCIDDWQHRSHIPYVPVTYL